MSTIELGELLSINQGNTDKIDGHESPEDLEKKLDSMIKDENDTITFDLSPFDKEDKNGDLYFWSFNDPKYKHLVKHPVVEAFLLIKWDSIWGWYFFNWFIYLIFLIVLTIMVHLDLGKVIIQKSRGGVSLVEQDTIEYISVANLRFIFKFLKELKKNHLQWI